MNSKKRTTAQHACLLVALLFFGVAATASAYLCGTPRLSTHFSKDGGQPHRDVVQTPEQHPTAPALPAAPALPLGTQRTFFAPDFRSMQQYTVSAVLRGVGRFCYVFVEEAEWHTRVTPGTVQALMRAFETATPANPHKGIYPTLTEVFGAPPDIDGNQRILILLLNIQEPRGTNTYTAGFFNPADQTRGLLRNPGFRGFPIRSNEAEMLYMDTHPLNPDSERAHTVIAHEFQHLLHWHHDPREVTWVDEGCAMFASFLCGYSVEEHIAAYERTPSISVVTWPAGGSDSLPHYGAAFLWMLYLYEQYGGLELVIDIVENRGTSLTGISAALAARGIRETLSDIFIDYKLANYLSTYQAVTLSLTPHRWHQAYPSGTQTGQLPNFSAAYIGFRDAEGLTLGFSSRSAAQGVSVHALEFRKTGTVTSREVPLAPGNTGSIVFAKTATEVILVPSLHVETIDVDAPRLTYEYTATRGAHLTFVTAAFPNPVHPLYWDILAESAEPLVGLGVPTLTLMLADGKTQRLYRKAAAMSPVLPENRLYRASVLLEPGVAPQAVIYQVSLESRPVGTGTLLEPIQEGTAGHHAPTSMHKKISKVSRSIAKQNQDQK